LGCVHVDFGCVLGCITIAQLERVDDRLVLVRGLPGPAPGIDSGTTEQGQRVVQ